jgi:hypothetical protein
MSDDATLWDLVTDERIAIEDVGAAVDVYLSEPSTQDYPIGPDHVLDLAAAVAAHASAPLTMADSEADEPSRRMAVRAALLMARPASRSPARLTHSREEDLDAPLTRSGAATRHRRH